MTHFPCKRLFVVAFVAAFSLPLLAPSADAQILNRIKKRVEERVERRAEDAADKAVDKAADAATGRATDAAGNAVGNAAANAVGLPPGMAGDGSIEGLADFRKLQEVLPESFAGMARTDIQGEATAAMGMKLSTAKAQYEGGGRSVRLAITDTGTMRAFLTMSAAWMGMSVDQETNTGFTRTITLRDMPAYVQEDRSGGMSSNVQLVVADRLLLSAEADGMNAASLQAAVESLDLAKLQEMAAELAELAVPLVSFDQLMTHLPQQVAGFSRANPTGETGGVAGLEMSQAAVTFTRGDESMTVTVLDLGSLSGVTALTYAGWLSIPINRKTSEGFERTTRYGSHPAFEEQQNENGDGSLRSQVQVAVAKRFLVTVEGNVPFEDAQAAVKSIDLDALARLAEVKSKSE